MNHYIHHIPGKVRIKNSMFQNNPDELDELRKSFEGIAGIDFITTNPLTGSIVIHYDVSVIDQERFKQILLIQINRPDVHIPHPV
jgi:hypothetical protein